jgi:subtilisin family serine protease
LLVVPPIPTAQIQAAEVETAANIPLDFHTLAGKYGEQIPVVAKFTDALTSFDAELLKSFGVSFGLGSAKDSYLAGYYLLRGSAESLELLKASGLVKSLNLQTTTDHLVPARDLSIPEINADQVWNALDGIGRNITGEGILIADLDTGVDWQHPDLWFADGAQFDWLDENSNNIPDNGTDGVDLDSSGSLESYEVLRYIDLDLDGTFNATTDWLWVENIKQDGIVQRGEPFFVVDDANSNDTLDPGEKLIKLDTPKTKYIVEKNGVNKPMVWQRGLNLTLSNHTDTDGHGTGVSGILLGGQLGYRKYVGVAPKADLMMIKVFGTSSEAFTIIEGLAYAYNHGADVILIEVGQWVEVFMDGSSYTEWFIDYLNSNGVPVIVPSGNLGGNFKHAKYDITGVSTRNHIFNFDIPHLAFSEEHTVYITVLTTNDTDFMTANFTVGVPTGPGPPLSDTLLHPNYGNRSYGFDSDLVTGINYRSYVLNSNRGTKMMHIEMWPTAGGFPAPPPFYELEIVLQDNATVHCYIADSATAWQGGAVWSSDINNEYLITHPSTADDALSVASYHTRSIFGTIGSIASYSAIGPRIDGVSKQGIAAPGGFDIVSDFSNYSTWASWFNGSGALPLNPSFGGYRLFSGTSAAGPHVAGAAALMLQVSPSSGSIVSDVIKNTARTDSDTGTVHNPTWGYGKLDALAAVSYYDASPPVIHSVGYSPSIVEYTDSILFEANVTDNSGVSGVFLKFEVGGWLNPIWNQMNIQPSGNYTVSIGSFSYSNNVTYSVFANDTNGNPVETSPLWIIVGDSISPVVLNPWRNATTPGEDRFVGVSIDVSEPISASGVDKVLLNYTIDSWSTFSVLELSSTGSSYSGTIPGHTLGTTVEYYFWANDTAGNPAQSSILSYTTVADEWNPPIIGDPLQSPTNVTESDSVTINVTVTDDTAVDFVILSYFNGTAWTNITMVLQDGVYVATIPPQTSGKDITYRIYARDTLGNWAVSGDTMYTVESNTTPPPTTPPPEPLDYLRLALMLGIVLLFIVIAVAISRRRSR